MDIASRIDLAMKIAGIRSQADLARQSGLPESTIARILKIGGNPSIDTIAALSKTLKVSIDWIVDGNETNKDEVPDMLAYLSRAEMLVITRMREATAAGKTLIINASQAASKRTPPPEDQSLPDQS